MPRIALFQSRTGIDPQVNANRMVAAVREAADGGAEILFTPEMSGLVDRNGARAAAHLKAEQEDPVLEACRAAAREVGVWLHIGSLAIRTEGGKLANRAFVIDNRGAVRGRYDKMHLFDVDLPTGESWRESATYCAGEEAVVIDDTPVGRLGLAICYDMRFPALFERLAEAGAQCVSVPAAFTVPTGRAHWEVLLRARAIESAMFVVAAAQSGEHEDGRVTYGHSLVVDPWGEVLLDMKEEVGVAFADLDLAKLGDVRSRIPSLSHRRLIARASLL